MHSLCSSNCRYFFKTDLTREVRLSSTGMCIPAGQVELLDVESVWVKFSVIESSITNSVAQTVDL